MCLEERCCVYRLCLPLPPSWTAVVFPPSTFSNLGENLLSSAHAAAGAESCIITSYPSLFSTDNGLFGGLLLTLKLEPRRMESNLSDEQVLLLEEEEEEEERRRRSPPLL